MTNFMQGLNGALARGEEVMRQRILALNDPCDETVSVAQVIEHCRPKAARMVGVNYDQAGAILGCTREEAKLRIYKYCYGG